MRIRNLFLRIRIRVFPSISKKWRKTLISNVLWLLYDFLSLRNAVMYWLKELDPHPDPLVTTSTDSRIRNPSRSVPKCHGSRTLVPRPKGTYWFSDFCMISGILASLSHRVPTPPPLPLNVTPGGKSNLKGWTNSGGPLLNSLLWGLSLISNCYLCCCKPWWRMLCQLSRRLPWNAWKVSLPSLSATHLKHNFHFSRYTGRVQINFVRPKRYPTYAAKHFSVLFLPGLLLL